jgi:hypothetical protein
LAAIISSIDEVLPSGMDVGAVGLSHAKAGSAQTAQTAATERVFFISVSNK